MNHNSGVRQGAVSINPDSFDSLDVIWNSFRRWIPEVSGAASQLQKNESKTTSEEFDPSRRFFRGEIHSSVLRNHTMLKTRLQPTGPLENCFRPNASTHR